tara:strand:- start:1402 stop:1992 length:591 start_codon:yes stop_codon:yes gene_type:complete
MGIKTKKRVQSDMKDKVDMKLNNVFELANGMEEEYVNEPYEMKVERVKENSFTNMFEDLRSAGIRLVSPSGRTKSPDRYYGRLNYKDRFTLPSGIAGSLKIVKDKKLGIFGDLRYVMPVTVGNSLGLIAVAVKNNHTYNIADDNGIAMSSIFQELEYLEASCANLRCTHAGGTRTSKAITIIPDKKFPYPLVWLEN